MQNAAAFRATYSDWKLIRTRTCVQVVFEVPLEAANEAYQALGGMPDPGSERWFAIARLREDKHEVYNDLDQDAVALFRVLRDPTQADHLLDHLRLTPFSKMEFEGSYIPAEDQVERARRLLIRSFMGFGSNGHNAATKTGFRANSNRSGTTPARDWANYPDLLPTIIERLTGVVIECRDACEVMSAHDEPHTLHYVDPPYVRETRSKAMHRNGCYAHELDEAGHVRLLGHLRSLTGMVVLSGYAHPLYDEALSDWRRVETAAHADGARDRTEILWINPQACAAHGASQAQISLPFSIKPDERDHG